jgi:putative DNA primase/helicase
MTAAIIDVTAAFAAAMRRCGIEPPSEIIFDGKLRRFTTNGKPTDKAGWYVAFSDGVPAITFGDWRHGVSHTWCAGGRTMTAAEQQAHRDRVAQARRQREVELAAAHAEAARRAQALLDIAVGDVAAHPYAQRKAVPMPPGVKRGAYPPAGWKDALLVPLHLAGGALASLQAINVDGQKRFSVGGRARGAFHPFGTLRGAERVLIGEGIATVAAAVEATGWPAAAAMSANNLEVVARAVRALAAPGAELVLLADNDCQTESNPGVTAATEAARAVGGRVVVPPAIDGRATDLWDVYSSQGGAAVLDLIDPRAPAAQTASPGKPSPDERADKARLAEQRREAEAAKTRERARLAALRKAKESAIDVEPREAQPAAPDACAANTPADDVTGVTGVQASNHAGLRVTPAAGGDVTDVAASPIPGAEQRPKFVTLDEPLRVGDQRYRAGVWFFGAKQGRKDDDRPVLTEQWVCSPLHVEAVTSDASDGSYGRLLRFRNTNGRWRTWAMPMDMLRADGADLRGELLAMGVTIDPGAHKLLGQYLQALTPKRRVHCALRVGWHKGAFVLPDEVIGPGAEDVIFQSGERAHDEYTRAGTLDGWRSGVAALAAGNPLLVLAIAASFVGPLLSRCGAEGGGIHLVGDSSTGKTTAIEAACSAWGGPNYRRSWRATANGIEGAASMFNDGLLALDEISECDPREIGAITYALANGYGKQRASRSGAARSVARWRCMVLSSGERTLATAMAEGGRMPKAGQAVRLLDVPVARKYGAWDDLHGHPSGAALSDAIKRAASTHYGHAGREFLRHLAHDKRNLADLLDRVVNTAFVVDGDGQAKRAAARFALVALAGEIAREYGVVDWPAGEAITAAAGAMRAWQSLRGGGGNQEQRQIPERVVEFIERHGDSRFSAADAPDDARVINRAGWWRDATGGRVYLFTAAGLREALIGFDFKRALDVLQEVGALPASGGERAKPERIGGRLVRLYAIHADKLGDRHEC